jgi:hypothetical protein
MIRSAETGGRGLRLPVQLTGIGRDALAAAATS